MSEIEFSLMDAKDWIVRETSSSFIPIHAQANRLLDKMRKALENLADASKVLFDSSGKEIEKRNMKTYQRARALNKLARLFLDRTRQIEVPDKSSCDGMSNFVKEAQKQFLATEVDVRKWFSKISPFFILDRRRFLTVFGKAKESLDELQSFLEKEYVKTKAIEETFRVMDELENLEKQLADINSQKVKMESKEKAISEEITRTQQKIINLKNDRTLSELDRINMETKKLRTEFRRNLQHLRKPFVKFQVLMLRGKGNSLTLEESQKLNSYVEKPFEAFATEGDGYPLLKQILQKLNRSFATGKLKLKSDRKRKAEYAIEKIVGENSLAGLHEKCVNMRIRRLKLSASSELADTRDRLLDLQENLTNLETKKKSLELKEDALNHDFSEKLEKIQERRDQIEKNVLDHTGNRIHIKKRAFQTYQQS